MSEKKGTWGGKREGAGRKKSVAYTSKTYGIYCSQRELIRVKNFLAFERCLMADVLNLNGRDEGEFRLEYRTVQHWMGGIMEEEDWEQMRSCLEPATVERLKKEYEKKMPKLNITPEA